MEFLYLGISLLITLSIHEAAHALVAYYLGDPTAKLQGRLTLNPVKHLDVMGTIVFIVTQRIGWGKPVPVNPNNFSNPIKDNALTALAGPVSNFVLAFALVLPLKYLDPYMPQYMRLLLWMIFNVNIFIGVFNLLPFPPLDGSKIIGVFIPRKYYRHYLNYLDNGVKYFVAGILIDVFILGSLLGFSILGFLMQFLFEKVKFLILLGT